MTPEQEKKYQEFEMYFDEVTDQMQVAQWAISNDSIFAEAALSAFSVYIIALTEFVNNDDFLKNQNCPHAMCVMMAKTGSYLAGRYIEKQETKQRTEQPQKQE